MSAFGKSALFNGENIASESVKEDFETNSTVENQVSKFDNSYSTNEKLQELYNEFDKITLDENKIKDIFLLLIPRVKYVTNSLFLLFIKNLLA